MPPCGDVNTAVNRQTENQFCGDDKIPHQIYQLFQHYQGKVRPFRPYQVPELHLQGLAGPQWKFHLKKLLEHSAQEILSNLLSKLENILTTCQRGQVNRQMLNHSHSADSLLDVHTSLPYSGHLCELSSLSESNRGLSVPSLQDVNPQHEMDANEQHFQSGENVPNDSGFGSFGVSFSRQKVHDSNRDFEKLERNAQELSECQFYYGNIDSQRAKHLLHKKPAGTFLIRDSSDSRYLYSLSVNTKRGATSVRILYSHGLFQFDSDEKIRDKLPQFESVLELVDFHVKVTQGGGNKSWRWEEPSGKKSLRVELTEPLLNSVPSLAHLARVKTNKCLEDVHLPELSVDRLPIQSNLKEYLREYPYQV